MSSSKNNRQIKVVMRGPSAVIFSKGKNLELTDVYSKIGPVKILYTTRWLEYDNDLFMPGHLWIEISGPAPSLEKALAPFANAALSTLPIFSLSANAAIGEPDVEISYDYTKGLSEREYFQSYVIPETKEIHNARHINIDATISLLESITTHPDSERLKRAASQYRLSLNHWRLGRDSLALAHLWMALEALTKAQIRQECLSRNLSDQNQLADALDIDIRKLDPYIRKSIILCGDDECYKKAKKASDGFEHGFLNFDKINNLSQSIRIKMAKYIRSAIFNLCSKNEDILSRLTKDPFDEPIGYWPIVKYVRGKLLGEGEQLAKDGNAYPFMQWKTILESTSYEDGKFNMKVSDSLTAQIGENIKFQPISREVWQV